MKKKIIHIVFVLFAICILIITGYNSIARYYQNVIPTDLVAAVEGEKRPFVSFKKDNTCVVNFYTDNGVVGGNGEYQLLKTKGNDRLIKVDIPENIEGEIGVDLASSFYLIENDNGNWTYFGANIGELLCDMECESLNNKKIRPNKKSTLSDAVIKPGYYENNQDLNNKRQIYIEKTDNSNEFKITITCGDCVFDSVVELYGNLMFFSKTQYLLPLQISRERFENEILAYFPEGRNKDTFESFYVLMSLDDPTLTTTGKQQMLEIFPIVAKYDLYVFSTDATEPEINRMEQKIKTYCPHYSFDEMEYDHQLVEYELTEELQKKYQSYYTSAVLEFSDDGIIDLNFVHNLRSWWDTRNLIFKYQ